MFNILVLFALIVVAVSAKDQFGCIYGGLSCPNKASAMIDMVGVHFDRVNETFGGYSKGKTASDANGRFALCALLKKDEIRMIQITHTCNTKRGCFTVFPGKPEKNGVKVWRMGVIDLSQEINRMNECKYITTI